ncbi:hypothetical protein Q5P01_003761 [Channa striata]|uniref:Uncharacterized protein n=1 Tax=Channa striata TaxID=64152 RepID=A0AA88T515_CHASR|nr:hypothetical protein Q5P01_003761 [Channa striata]
MCQSHHMSVVSRLFQKSNYATTETFTATSPEKLNDRSQLSPPNQDGKRNGGNPRPHAQQERPQKRPRV